MSTKASTIVCLMGPTAAGKTHTAIDLVKRFPFEIISVDSAMIYRGMDIGTAKPDADILRSAPHRLIDICDPAETYSAGQFSRDVVREIDDILSKGKIPLLVGGTMLYFRVLQQGMNELPTANSSVRLALKEAADQIGWPALHEKLVRIDSVSASKIHPHDSQRIQRALEVYETTGKTLTEWQQSPRVGANQYQIQNFIISPQSRAVLHERIEQRFDAMLANGFLDEVKGLFERGDLSLSHPSIRSVGYRQVWEYFSGQLSKEEMRNHAIFATRQFAKRQLTWLKSWPNAEWLAAEDLKLADKIADFG